MQRCARCDTPLGGHACERCRAGAERAPRTDGGRRDDSPAENDDSVSEDGAEVWKEGRQPPHWERESPAESGGQPQQGGGEPGRGQPQQPGANPGQQPPGTAAEQPPGGSTGQQPQQPPQQGEHSQPPQQPPSRREPRSDDGGLPLSRRTLLAGGAGAAALAAGGWWVFLRGRSGPEAVVEQFLDAVDSRDVDTLRGVVHEDGPLAETLDLSDSGFEDEVGGLSIDIETIEQYDTTTPTDLAQADGPDQPEIQEFALVFGAFTTRRDPEEMDLPDGADPDQIPRENTAAQIFRVALTPQEEWQIWETDTV